MLKLLKKPSKTKQNASPADTGVSGVSRPPSAGCNASPDLDQVLAADATTRKKFLSQFRWFHNRQEISNRQAAETKLKLAAVNAAAGTVNKKKMKEEVIFLVRGSMICDDDFILSILAAQKCYHYVIQLTLHSEYLLVSVETPNHDQVTFRGLNELIDTLRKPNQYRTYVPVLTMECPRGEAPPPLAISHGYNNPLHEAITSGNSVLAMKIIAHAAHPPFNDRDSKGNTALHLAVKRNMKDVVKALLSLGAAVSPLDENRYSALHLACRTNVNKLIVYELLEKGANPQMRHEDTLDVALHMAAAAGLLDCVKALLARNVPCGVRNLANKTPYELARDGGHRDCEEELDKYRSPAATAKRTDWFHDSIDRDEASNLLNKHGCRDGLFLLRASSRDPGRYVLDLCCKQRVMRFKIDTTIEGTVFYIGNGPLLSSLEHLVDYYSRYNDGLDHRLTYALSSHEDIIVIGVPESIGNGPRSALPPRDRPPVASEPLVLDKSSITIGTELGQGEYGSVMQGTWKSPSGELVPVAIKTLNSEHMTSGKEGFLREAQVMVKLDHPCIVKLIGVSQGQPLMLVQELLSMGSLLDFLLDYPEKVDIDYDLHLWAGQIAYGMSYLEKELLVHRDLAARNILLASKSQVKICDFGLSRAVGVNDYYRATHGGKWPVKWYAPEAMNYGTFSSASDVWSYGVTLWEMFALGAQPYDDMTGSQVLQKLERKGRLEKPILCPVNIYQLMLHCWEYKPADRPTFHELHTVFQRAQKYENVLIS